MGIMGAQIFKSPIVNYRTCNSTLVNVINSMTADNYYGASINGLTTSVHPSAIFL